MSDRLEVDIDFKDGVYKEIDRLIKLVDQLAGKFDHLEKEVDQGFKEVEASVENVGKSVNKSLGQINFMAVTENVRNFRQTLQSVNEPGLEFQQQMADLEAITGITGDNLEMLGDKARSVGIDEGMGAAQGVETFKLLASNIDVAKIGMEGLVNLQEKTIKLSQTSRDIDLPMAADIMASTINQYQFDASQADRVINVLAAGAKKGAAELPDLAMSLKNTGTTAALAGVSLEETVGSLEVLSQQALKGAEAGTGLRNVITLLQTKLGVDLKQTSLSSALQELKPLLNDTSALTKIFGRENLSVAQALIANADQVDEMSAAVTGTNTAYEQAAIQTNTYAHEINKIHAYFDDLKISIFEATGPVLPFTEVLFGVVEGAASIAPIFTGVQSAMSLFGNTAKITTSITKAWNATQAALNATFLANPIFLVVAGIAALVAGVMYAWNTFEGFREVVYGLWEAFKQVFTNIFEFAKRIFAPIMEAITAFKEGRYGDAALALGQQVVNLTPIGIAKEAVDFATEGGFTAGVAEAYASGAADGIKSFREDQAKKEDNSTTAAYAGMPFGFQNGPTFDYGSPAPSGKSTKKDLSSISGAGSGAGKQTNLTIEKIEFNINTGSIGESIEAFKDRLAQALMASLRDVEAAV